MNINLTLPFKVKIQKREIGREDGLDFPVGFWVLECGRLELLVFESKKTKGMGDIYSNDSYLIGHCVLADHGLNPKDLK